MIRIKKLSGIIVLISFVILASLLYAGCPRHIDSLYGVQINGDGSGGAFAVYEDKLGGNIYLQRINPEGESVWGDKGMLLGVSRNQWAYSFANTRIVSDGSGGAIIVWPENRSSSQVVEPTYHIIKLNYNGQTMFSKVYKRLDQTIGDGTGGVIFDYSPDEATVFIGRIDSMGNSPWGQEGISLTNAGNTRQIAGDGLGGAIIVREDLRYPEGAKPGETFSKGYIYAQKIDSQGQLVWGEEGLLLYSTPEDAYAETLQITGDINGGAIIAWHQQPMGRIETGSIESFMMDILVQKVDANGKVLWRDGGLPLGISQTAAGAFPLEPRLVSDGTGGAIILWRDSREDIGIYAQRVNADGALIWPAGGVKVASTSLNPNPMIISDGTGGAIISYALQEGIYVQKINASGETIWPGNGIQVVKGKFQGYSIVPDDQGGLIAGWGIGKGLFSSEKADAQRLNADGKQLWGDDGARLNR